MHSGTATQAAGMGRKQHKRGYISKQHSRRENSREMLFDVSYKSDTMHNKLHTIESNKSDRMESTLA